MRFPCLHRSRIEDFSKLGCQKASGGELTKAGGLSFRFCRLYTLQIACTRRPIHVYERSRQRKGKTRRTEWSYTDNRTFFISSFLMIIELDYELSRVLRGVAYKTDMCRGVKMMRRN